ncbi:DEAD/DEAH box helicase family protein [Stenotrophomonas maltophilia]|uniref:DEAD/DEAH box helicase family protein n=1 Tax=Stenotrophomonas maltophilia TaxID=40324 RepID=UPI0035CCEB8E
MQSFLSTQSLLQGSLRTLERDVARLLVCNGFQNVREVARSGESGGADILASKNGDSWIIRCFDVGGRSFPELIRDLIDSAKFHGAGRVYLATNRRLGEREVAELKRWQKVGLGVDVLEPKVLLSLAERSPEYPSGRKDLRSYQEEAMAGLLSALTHTGRGQVVLATGLGKTVVMAEVLAQLFRDAALSSGRALVLAGTRELVDQLQRAFWAQLPKWVATARLMGGELPISWDGVTFATVQSAIARLEDLPDFDVLLIDEAHHVGSESLGSIIGRYATAMIGGVTATPWRGDGYDLDRVLGPPAMKMGIADGIRLGYLCKAEYRLLSDGVDWKLVSKISRNRYSIGQLNRLLFLPSRDEEAAREIRATFDRECRKSIIIFCQSVRHSLSFAATLRLFGIRAEAINGEMSIKERDRNMASFRSGHIQALTTRDLLNEGVDVPDVDMIVFMRVTHSRRIFVQQLGRGLRISPGKSKVVVLDFVSDLRRISEVIRLEQASKGGVERISSVAQVNFESEPSGKFLMKWLADQADLLEREGDPILEIPGSWF